MVKEFEQDPQSEIWLFLDSFKMAQAELPYQLPEGQVDSFFSKRPNIVLPPSTFEYGVCISASLARYFLNQRRAVGFVTAAQTSTIISAERSERQEYKILETLAYIRGDGGVPFAELITMQMKAIPRGSSVILITPTRNENLVVAVDNLLFGKLNPVVVSLEPYSFGAKGKSFDVINPFAERGIPVCEIKCHDDIGGKLAEFGAQHNTQESFEWRPQFTL